MEKVIAFIDGFNLYHSLRENGCNHLKWLNYWDLANAFVIKSKESLVKVIYFSALVSWDPNKEARHKLYIRALETRGVEVVLGKFKRVTKTCRADCKKQYQTFEEKETDINIAAKMMLESSKNPVDKILLFSGDSDMIAGVKAMKEFAPGVHIKAIIPYHRSSEDLINNCHSCAKIKLKHLENNQLPDNIDLGNGKYLSRPREWT